MGIVSGVTRAGARSSHVWREMRKSVRTLTSQRPDWLSLALRMEEGPQNKTLGGSGRWEERGQ